MGIFVDWMGTDRQKREEGNGPGDLLGHGTWALTFGARLTLSRSSVFQRHSYTDLLATPQTIANDKALKIDTAQEIGPFTSLPGGFLVTKLVRVLKMSP